MKTTLWDIRGVLQGFAATGIMAVGLSAVADNTLATAQNTAATVDANVASGTRTRTGALPQGAEPTQSAADLEELRRRNPLAFGSSNPFSIKALGGAATVPIQGVIYAVTTSATDTNMAVIDLGNVFRSRIDRSNMALDQINAGIQAGAARPVEFHAHFEGATFSDEAQSQRTIDMMFSRARTYMKGIS
jgi:hypothetical protein